VRYRKKSLKRIQLEIRQKEALEQAELQGKFKDFQLTEKQNRRIKLKAEREEARRFRKELKTEFRERKIQDKKEWEKLSAEDRLRAKKERLHEKKENRKALKQNARVQFRDFIDSFRSINIKNFKLKIREFKDNAPNRRRFGIIVFNSTTLYLLSYLSLFLFSQVVTVIAASYFKYPTIVHYYEIYFNISPEAWYHDSVRTIFSSGPMVNFVVGVCFLIIFSNIRELTGPFKLFFLWGFLHAVNMLFGALLIGTLFETGVGHVISWMYIMDTGKVLYSIVSIFLLVIAGLLATRQFLISGNTYYNEINPSNRTTFIISQVFIPYLIANIFLILVRQPHFVFYDTFIGLTLIISILPIMVTYRTYHDVYFEEEEKKAKIDWRSIIALLAALAFFRGVLDFGLRFGG
jgi:hypothetical protein